MPEALRLRVLADPSLQDALRSLTDLHALARRLEELSEVPLDVPAWRSEAMRSWIERAVPGPPRPLDTVDVAGLTPVDVQVVDGRPVVEWMDLRGVPWTAPFFMDTVRQAAREPYRIMFRARTGIEALGAVAEAGADVAGLVMHTSRCGSTLVCRMLGTVPAVRVLSEPVPCDQVLRAPGVAAEDRARWFGWLVRALGHPGARSVIKLDAWSVQEMDIIRAALPGARWVFLQRDPAEVIASQLRNRGMHMMPGVLAPELFGLDLRGALALSAEDYCAHVLASITAAAGRALDADAIVVDYAELPDAVVTRICPHFGLEPDPDAMSAAAAFDAKRPRARYDPGGDAEVTPAIRAAAGRVSRVTA